MNSCFVKRVPFACALRLPCHRHGISSFALAPSMQSTSAVAANAKVLQDADNSPLYGRHTVLQNADAKVLPYEYYEMTSRMSRAEKVAQLSEQLKELRSTIEADATDTRGALFNALDKTQSEQPAAEDTISASFDALTLKIQKDRMRWQMRVLERTLKKL